MYVLTVILFMWVYCVVNMSEFLTSLLPSKLDVATDIGESFSLWERRWLDYCDLSEMDKKSKEQQMAIFRACLSDDTLKIVLNLDLDDTKKDKHKDVLEALRLHAQGTANVVIERRKFNLRVQQEGGSFDNFLTSLRELAKTCKFCDNCQESLLRDRIGV